VGNPSVTDFDLYNNCCTRQHVTLLVLCMNHVVRKLLNPSF